MKTNRVFQAFEYSAFNIINEGREGRKLPEDLWQALKSFSGEKELPYYSLTANGVRFKNYVGALQVGKWTIEILPKLDRTLDESSTQPVLIQMLRQAGFIKTSTPTESRLKLKRNFILEAYLQMFLDETRKLIHNGLIRKYRKTEGNEFALKGRLIFSKHLNKNQTHAERFYIRYTIYNRQHELNRVLLKTLKILTTLSVNRQLITDAKSLILHFPDLEDITVSDEFYSRIIWGRKTDAYKKAIEISRLLLLNYHPDLSHGKNHVLALMFDMNNLWEKWFAHRLKIAFERLVDSVDISFQSKKEFWKPSYGKEIYQKSDIIIDFKGGSKIIIDTKWKLINDRPSEEDLRQMFTYNKLFDSNNSFLIYPGIKPPIYGEFFNYKDHGTCGLKFVSFLEDGKLSSHGIDELVSELLLIQ